VGREVLITGGAGFLGSNLAHYWTDKYTEDTVTVVDRGSTGSSVDNLAGLEDKIFFMQADVKDIDPQIEYDLIFLLHSETHVDRGFNDPLGFFDANTLSTVVFLERMRRKGSKAKFIYMSTDEVLDHEAPLETPKEVIFSRPDEGAGIFNPTNPYSATKAATEMFIKSYIASFNMDITIVRCTNMYGPRQWPEKLIPKAITAFLKGEAIDIYGAGAQYRDYLYVEDACRALDIISGKTRAVFHISANEERTNVQSINEVQKQMDKGSMNFIDDPRPFHDFAYSLSSKKLRGLGWKPLVSFEEGVAKTIDWFKSKC